MPRPLLHIELKHPPSVNGRPARYQSLWLLLRAWQAHLDGEDGLSAAAVRARFPGSANLRMLVSRAYAEFSQWGVDVGWGSRQDLAPALRNPRGRSRGPFWLDAATARRLRIRLGGKQADAAALAQFLRAEDVPSARRDALAEAMQDLAYWNRLAQALRLAQDGPMASGVDAVHGFRAAGACARDGFQSAFALLKEGLAWRREGRIDRSEEAIKRLEQVLPEDASALPAVAAMACIARAWNGYSRGDPVRAHAELERLASNTPLRPVLQYNPRVRFEYLNLRALLRRSTALFAAQASASQRAQAASEAIDLLAQALQAAWEAESAAAAQDVAANLGWTLWLCWQERLLDSERELAEAEVQAQSLRWIALSEWICDRFGVGGNSAWNTIFVLRIVRGSARDGVPPLSVQQLREATRPFDAPFSPAKGYNRWSAVAGCALEEHDAGRNAYGPLQVANLLLESAWFLACEKGVCKEACAAVERLAGMLPALRPEERRFFRDGLRALPEQLAAIASDAVSDRRPAAARRRSTARRG